MLNLCWQTLVWSCFLETFSVRQGVLAAFLILPCQQFLWRRRVAGSCVTGTASGPAGGPGPPAVTEASRGAPAWASTPSAALLLLGPPQGAAEPSARPACPQRQSGESQPRAACQRTGCQFCLYSLMRESYEAFPTWTRPDVDQRMEVCSGIGRASDILKESWPRVRKGERYGEGWSYQVLDDTLTGRAWSFSGHRSLQNYMPRQRKRKTQA